MASTSKADTGRRNTIGGFLVDKIDHDVMRDWVMEHGGGFPFEGVGADDPAENLAVAMHSHFQKTISEDDLCACDACDGEGPDTPSCVFCGFRGQTAEVPAPAAEPAKPVSSKKLKTPKTSAKTKEAAAEGDAGTEEDTDMAIANIDEGHTVKKSSAKARGAKEKSADEAPKTSGALVKVEGGLATAKTLDRIIKEALDLKQSSTNDYVGFGRKVLEINEKGLHKLRLDDNGKARYASWDAFVTAELGITPAHSFSLIKIAKEFTDDDVKALGRSKLTLILQAPPASRKELVNDAKTGNMSKREVAKQVKEVRERAGYEGDTPRAKARTKNAKANKAEKAATTKAVEKVTIAQIDGKKKIKVYARPQSIRNLKIEECKRAKGLADVPFMEIELTNEVSILVTITKGADGLLTATHETYRKA